MPWFGNFALVRLLFEVLLFEVLSISFTKEWDTLSVMFLLGKGMF